MSLPSVDHYVRSTTTYFSVIADAQEVPAAAQRRFGLRTYVDWTKNGAPIAAQEATVAVQSAFFSLEIPADVEMRGLGGLQPGEQERHFNCRKVEQRIYMVGDSSILQNAVSLRPGQGL